MRRPLPRPLLPALAPGLLLVGAVALVAQVAGGAARDALGVAALEPLVLAILFGMLVRTSWTPPARFAPGVQLAGRQGLEVAVALLGASVDLALLALAGPALAFGIALVVVLALGAGVAIGRAAGLPSRLALLVACGNAICGNSAIAALAPVIHAEKEHVASAIAFTAILGVGVVIGLPLLLVPLGLSDYEYGVLAGLTVYAVPQVLAAAFPVSALSGEVGTLVKLVRVLMLGPVVIFFAIRERRRTHEGGPLLAPGMLARFVPWFVTAFVVLALLRGAGMIPMPLANGMREASRALTVLAMAALGLGVDLRALRAVGASVVLAVAGSLVALLGLALALIRLVVSGA